MNFVENFNQLFDKSFFVFLDTKLLEPSMPRGAHGLVTALCLYLPKVRGFGFTAIGPITRSIACAPESFFSVEIGPPVPGQVLAVALLVAVALGPLVLARGVSDSRQSRPGASGRFRATAGALPSIRSKFNES